MQNLNSMSTETVSASNGLDLEECPPDFEGIVPQSTRLTDLANTWPAEQSDDANAVSRNDYSSHSAASPPTIPNAEESGRSLYAVEVRNAELVGGTVGILGWWPRGVRLWLAPIDCSDGSPFAELYFPVIYLDRKSVV